MNVIKWKPTATKQLMKISPKKQRERIYDQVQRLAHWPNLDADIKKLQSRPEYRLRVGDYRVIFEIDQDSNPIIIKIDEVRKRDEQTY